jgi:hypothetical protein
MSPGNVQPPAMRINAAETPGAAPPQSAPMWRTGTTIAFAVGLGLLVVSQRGMLGTPHPMAYGFLAVGVMYMISVWITGRRSPLQAAIGTDGRLSTSRFQFLFWTAVVAFTYAWLYAARAAQGNWETINDLPANALLAMGISVGTLATAQGITTSYLRSGLINKPSQPAENASAADLVANDNDAPDLTKIQMLVWTFIAAVVYLAQVAISWREYAVCVGPTCQFPDIDPALMVLMGLGQGAYLGNKLVTVNTPRTTSSAPTSGAWGTEVTLKGEAFGATPQWVTVNGVSVSVDAAKWKDNEVAVSIPRKRPSDGGDWRFHETVQIGLVVNGRQGVGSAPFQIMPPVIDAVELAKDAGGTKVTLKGSSFGPRQDDSAVLLDGVAHAPEGTTWTAGQIDFVLPADKWPAGKQVRAGVRMYGQTSPSEKTFTIPA